MRVQAVTDHVAIVTQDAHRFASIRHSHPQAQLIYAISGVVSVTTVDGTWVVPPNRAVWVPAGVEHNTKSHSAVQFRALLIDPAEMKGLPVVCTAMEVTPLLRELVLRLAALVDAPNSTDFRRAVTQLLLMELSVLPVEPLSLPIPESPPLARFCDQMLGDPARPVTLTEAAHALHMSRASFMRSVSPALAKASSTSKRRLGFQTGQSFEPAASQGFWALRLMRASSHCCRSCWRQRRAASAANVTTEILLFWP